MIVCDKLSKTGVFPYFACRALNPPPPPLPFFRNKEWDVFFISNPFGDSNFAGPYPKSLKKTPKL